MDVRLGFYNEKVTRLVNADARPPGSLPPIPHDLTANPKSRLNAGRRSQRIKESRLNQAPPPNTIRFYRRRAGMSLEDVGKIIGVSRETIRKLEDRDTWLDPERATEIGHALGLPKEIIGFSYAPNPYSWAARSLWVVGSVSAQDEITFGDAPHRHVAGGSHLPEDSVALDIQQGKMRGWLLVFRPESSERMSKSVLERQGLQENFIACLDDGATWWRHISPAARQGRYHLNSRHQDPIHDVRIAWVAKIVGIVDPLFDLPTREQLDELGASP
ncbi:helix-turn-helix transcriptional regulator [Bradyrhizobium guangdongense]